MSGAVEPGAARWPGPLRRLAAPVALAAAGALVYAQLRTHVFLLNWDDLAYVVENELVHGLTWEHVRAIFAGPYYGNYAPLHLLSYAVDSELWGLDPGALLLANAALHLLGAWLLWWLLRRLGASVTAALVAAAVFLLHPVQVESVAWVSERKTVLAMALALGATHAFLGYRELAGRARWVAYAASLVLSLAALLAKPVAVIVPGILAVLDLCWFAPEERRRWVLDKVPFVAAAAAIVAATLGSQQGAVAEGRAVFGMSPATTLYTMAPVVLEYLRMVIWPAGLSALYTPPVRTAPDATFLLSAAGLAALAVVGAVLWRRSRPAFGWYAILFLGLAPVLQVVPLPTLMNDRYLYFPMLGVAGLVAAGWDAVWHAAPAWRRAALAVAGCACAVALGTASHARAAVWRDDLTLWHDVTAKTPRASMAWVGLGMAYSDAGRVAEAIPAYQRALEMDPFYGLALNNLGGAYNQLGRPDQALPYLRRAVQVEPDSFNAFMNLGISCALTGDRGCAERAFLTAARLRPGAPEPFMEMRRLGIGAARPAQGGGAR